jgi:DNA repair protein RadC
MASKRTAKATRAQSEDDGRRYVPGESRPFVTPDVRRMFCNAADIWTDARALIGNETREHFLVYFLDVRHKLIGDRWIAAIGSLAGVEIHPREIWHEAIKRAAHAVICVHNHPSGDPTPSRQDEELTRRFNGVGHLVGIPILDHIVISRDGFVSLAGRGLCS